MSKKKLNRKKAVVSEPTAVPQPVDDQVPANEASVGEQSVPSAEPATTTVGESAKPNAVKKERGPSFCLAVRKILIRKPALTVADLSQRGTTLENLRMVSIVKRID